MTETKVKVKFKYEEKFGAFRMYYEEDTEIEILGSKFKISAGKGPLVEDVKSFSGSTCFYIENNVFIPKEVTIGDNVAILEETIFSKIKPGARVLLDNNVIVKQSRFAMRGITTVKNTVCIASSTIKESAITKSIVINSIISDSVVGASTISDFCDLENCTISHSNIITGDFEKSEIENCSKVVSARGRDLRLLDSVVDGKNNPGRIDLGSISFSNSEITSIFPISSTRQFPLLHNAKIQTMFDACFIGNRFFYKRSEQSDEQKYEYGKLDDERLFSFALTKNEIKNNGQEERKTPCSMVGYFIYKNFKKLIDNNLSKTLLDMGKIELDLSDWQIVYSSMYLEHIIDIAESDLAGSFFLSKEIPKRLGLDIGTKQLCGTITLMDQKTWLCVRNMYKITENIEDKDNKIKVL